MTTRDATLGGNRKPSVGVSCDCYCAAHIALQVYKAAVSDFGECRTAKPLCKAQTSIVALHFRDVAAEPHGRTPSAAMIAVKPAVKSAISAIAASVNVNVSNIVNPFLLISWLRANEQTPRGRNRAAIVLAVILPPHCKVLHVGTDDLTD